MKKGGWGDSPEKPVPVFRTYACFSCYVEFYKYQSPFPPSPRGTWQTCRKFGYQPEKLVLVFKTYACFACAVGIPKWFSTRKSPFEKGGAEGGGLEVGIWNAYWENNRLILFLKPKFPNFNPPSPLRQGGLSKPAENLAISPKRCARFQNLRCFLKHRRCSEPRVSVSIGVVPNNTDASIPTDDLRCQHLRPIPLLQGGLSYKLENMVIQKKIKCKFSKFVLFFSLCGILQMNFYTEVPLF